METRERLLPLVGACNFRDLGGYPTVDGRFTRWGKLFRSDTLHELTEEDLELLRQIGLTSIIDLRTKTELERTGRGPLAEEPIAYRSTPVTRIVGGQMVIPSPLLEAKLFIPRVRRGLVTRLRLSERLSRGAESARCG